MPKFIVTSPDGKDFEVNAPEGATQDQVIAYAKQQFQQTPDSFASRFARGLKDPVTGLAQLAYNALPESVQNAGNRLNDVLAGVGLTGKMPTGGLNEMVRQEEAAYRAPEGVDFARLAGNIASPVNIAAGAATPARLLATGGGRVLAGAGLGAAGGAMQPVTSTDYAEQLKNNVLLGSVLGGGLSAVGQGISRVIQPKASVNPDVALMKSLGIDVTPGQAAGGMANKIEQKLSSVPFMGGQIEKRRQTSLDQFSTAMFNKAGKPIDFTTDKKGFEALSELDNAVSDAYTKAVNKAGGVRFDDQFLTNAANLSDMAAQASNPNVKRVIDTQLNIMLDKVTKAGQVLPETWKEFDSNLGKLIRSEDSPAAINALKTLQQEWRQAAYRSNPEQAKLFSAADAGYKNLLRLEKATEAASKQEGVFTPNQLYRAARQFTDSKKASRQKTAPFMQEAMAAERVLGNSVPNSGTFDRAALGGLVGGAGVAVDPTFLIAPTLGALAYSSPVNKVLTGLLTSRPQSAQRVANAVGMASPYAGLLGAQAME